MLKNFIDKYSAFFLVYPTSVVLGLILGIFSLSGVTLQLPQKNSQNATQDCVSEVNCKLTQNMDREMTDKLVAANNQFGFKLFSQILEKEGEKNIFISPSSIAIALSMTYNGARGTTQQAMAQTLEFQDMSLTEINRANQEFQEIINSLNNEVQLSIANSLWTEENVDFYPDFIQANRNFYNAEVRQLDFSDTAAPSIINGWVKEKTNNKIDKIIDELKPNSAMVLLNAIYFKGSWEQKFSESETKESPFYLLDGTQKYHPMMFHSTWYPYCENDKFQAVALPYGEGRASMYVFLPRPQVGLSGFYQMLNAANWKEWMLRFDYRQVNLGLPRFKTEYEIQLNETLKALGMEIAFDEMSADFSGMRGIPPELFISEVKHKTFVEVNEEGTEAAATTGVTIATRSMPKIFQMIINRPFFFAIIDNETGSILFMGAIVNPDE